MVCCYVLGGTKLFTGFGLVLCVAGDCPSYSCVTAKPSQPPVFPYYRGLLGDCGSP